MIDEYCKNNDVVIYLFVRKFVKVRVKFVKKDFEVFIVVFD